LLAGSNYFLFVWAVTSGHVVEASLGYYINPLVIVLLGIMILRERLTRIQLAALILAAAGVAVITVSHGTVPWVSLGLAFTFGLYGLIKKTNRFDAASSLLVEMATIAPVALIILVLYSSRGDGAFLSGDPSTTLLLVATGAITVVPLLLFGAGARRIPLSRVGFLQYIAPTLMLFIGTVLYDEPFTTTHAVSFGLIWLALGLYTASLVRRRGVRTETA
jgi:chloramphenicol-sensitive protein RarD